jgi:hypothetical protein
MCGLPPALISHARAIRAELGARAVTRPTTSALAAAARHSAATSAARPAVSIAITPPRATERPCEGVPGARGLDGEVESPALAHLLATGQLEDALQHAAATKYLAGVLARLLPLTTAAVVDGAWHTGAEVNPAAVAQVCGDLMREVGIADAAELAVMDVGAVDPGARAVAHVLAGISLVGMDELASRPASAVRAGRADRAAAFPPGLGTRPWAEATIPPPQWNDEADAAPAASDGRVTAAHVGSPTHWASPHATMPGDEQQLPSRAGVASAPGSRAVSPTASRTPPADVDAAASDMYEDLFGGVVPVLQPTCLPVVHNDSTAGPASSAQRECAGDGDPLPGAPPPPPWDPTPASGCVDDVVQSAATPARTGAGDEGCEASRPTALPSGEAACASGATDSPEHSPARPPGSMPRTPPVAGAMDTDDDLLDGLF